MLIVKFLNAKSMTIVPTLIRLEDNSVSNFWSQYHLTIIHT